MVAIQRVSPPMKTAILTFGHSYNSGTTLQAFALQKAIEKIDVGGSCDIINHWTKKPSVPLFLTHPSIKHLKGYVYLKGARRAQSEFLAEYASLRPDRPLLKDDLASFCSQYDRVVVGSDQVWNPQFTPGENPLRFLLDFIDDNEKKVAYAPSFGVKSLPEMYLDAFKQCLNKFNHLSVREHAGQEIIANLTGSHPPVVADPTLLLTESDWSRYIKTAAIGNYIFLYEKNENPKLESFAESLSKRTGLKIVRKRYEDLALNDSMDNWFIGPGEWLGLMKGASFVVTSSFHGVAFSLNFRKQFYVLPSSDTSSRVDELLDRFDLEDRRIQGEVTGVQSIDYSEVGPILERWRNESLSILSGFLKA